MSHLPLTGYNLLGYNNLPAIPPTKPLGEILNELFAASGGDVARLITVAPTGADYATIEEGIAAAAALVPTPSRLNAAIVKVAPGVYSENNPLVIPTGVIVDGYESVVNGDIIVQAQNPASDVFQLVGDHAGLADVQVEGATGASACGVRLNTANTTDQAHIGRITVTECYTGIIAERGQCSVNDLEVTKDTATMQVGIRITNANTDFAANNIQIEGESGLNLPLGILVDTNGRTHFASTRLEYCDLACQSLTGGILHIGGACDLIDCVNGVQVNNADCYIAGLNVKPTTDDAPGTDLEVIGANSEVFWTGGRLRSDKTVIDPLSTRTVIAAPSIRIGNLDPSFSILAELTVGSELAGKETALGEGDSHQRGMSVLTNTNLEAGTWADVTSDYLDPATEIDLFPGVGVGNTTYLGGNMPFPNAKMDIGTQAIVLGGGAIIFEYWDGATWTAFNFMVSNADFPYNQYGNNAFSQTATDEQVRWPELTGWATKTLDGVTKYWVRARITSAITTSPKATFIKLGTNRFEVNKDGHSERFGKSQVVKELLVHQRLADDLSGAAPGNDALALTSNITITPNGNAFANNTTDGQGEIITVPEGLDTSRPLTFEITYKVTDNTAGDVEFETYHAIVGVGDTIDGTITDTLNTVVDSVPINQQNVVRRVQLSWEIPTAVPGDSLAFSYFRDASAGNPDDTYANNISIIQIRLLGTFWET